MMPTTIIQPSGVVAEPNILTRCPSAREGSSAQSDRANASLTTATRGVVAVSEAWNVRPARSDTPKACR